MAIQNSINASYPVNTESGGTGVISPTEHGVMVAQGSSPITTKVLTDGQLLIGSTGNDPVAASLSGGTNINITGGAGSVTVGLNGQVAVANGGTGLGTLPLNQILIGNGTGNVNSIGLNNGQIVIGATGGAPLAGTLTAGFGINISNGTNSITISSTGIMPTVTVTGTTQTLSVNTKYLAANATGVTFTLPATSAVGDEILIMAKGPLPLGSWTIAQLTGQTIYYGNQTTTTGTGGSISTTQARDTLRLMCVTANTEWQVMSSQGNMNVV